MNFRAQGLKGRSATVIDMTALVDVVFQLLIFFLLTSNYVKQQDAAERAAKVQLELPETQLEADDEPAEDVTIEIDAEGEVYLEGEHLTSMDELEQRIAEQANQHPNTIVLLRGSKDASYGKIAQVIALTRTYRLKVSAVLQSQ